MGLPWKHLFALIRDYPNAFAFQDVVRTRWLKSKIPTEFEDINLVKIIEDHLLKKEKDGKFKYYYL